MAALLWTYFAMQSVDLFHLDEDSGSGNAVGLSGAQEERDIVTLHATEAGRLAPSPFLLEADLLLVVSHRAGAP